MRGVARRGSRGGRMRWHEAERTGGRAYKPSVDTRKGLRAGEWAGAQKGGKSLRPGRQLGRSPKRGVQDGLSLYVVVHCALTFFNFLASPALKVLLQTSFKTLPSGSGPDNSAASVLWQMRLQLSSTVVLINRPSISRPSVCTCLSGPAVPSVQFRCWPSLFGMIRGRGVDCVVSISVFSN